MKNASRRILTDSFGRFHNYLRISLTERCNLRCNYCMPENGIDLTEDTGLLKLNEFHRLISIFARNGVDKIRLTGGEPTVNRSCIDVIKMVNEVGVKKIAMTSNGLVLKNMLLDFKLAGLTQVNISLDTLIEAKFNFLTKRQGLSRVLDSIFYAEQLFGFVKVNCVVMKGFNDDEVINLFELTKEKNIDLRFIEFMPFSENSKLSN